MTSEYSQPPQPTPFLRKPLWVIEREEQQGIHSGPAAAATTSPSASNQPDAEAEADAAAGARGNHSGSSPQGQRLERHYTLLDLVSVGVGGTIGSGVFVLCGLIARDHAGPATCVSWGIAGAAAFLSGCCYAELSGRIPSAGSSYAYAYVSMGELPAVITAAMLTLEFLVSGAAVARSWGDKVVEWLKVELNEGSWVTTYLAPGYGFNPMAFLLSIITTSIVYGGVKESTIVTDFFTWLKVLLVIFMAVGGLVLFDADNLKPFAPYGFAGIMRGATSSFFGYLGYDGICCVAGEAINPAVNLPRAVLITLVLVTVLYIVAAFALTGMQHYSEISPESGFPEAFKAAGVNWAAQLTAVGEIVTLPVVVLLSPVLQPRLQYALAWDGFLPPMFKEVDHKGNLRKGILFSGGIMTLLAAFVPFTFLDDFVSAGILIAFTITNSSLVIMRRDSPVTRPFLLEKLLISSNLLSFITGLMLRHCMKTAEGRSITLCFFLTTALIGVIIACVCPPSTVFGGRSAAATSPTSLGDNGQRYFKAPWVPFIPLLGNFTNWYLVAQLDYWGIFLLLLYIALAVVLYYMYGAKNSVGNLTGWSEAQYEVACEMEPVHEDRHPSCSTFEISSSTFS